MAKNTELATTRFFRQHPRIDLTLPVEYTVDESADHHFSKTGTIGEGGLMLFLPRRLAIGSVLELKLHLPNYQSIVSRTRIVWTEILTGLEAKEFKTGVAFEEISAQDLTRLRNFLRDQQNPLSPLRSQILAYLHRNSKR